MKKKYIKEAKKIKNLMMQSLEEVDENNILQGEFVCHEDILGKEIGQGWHDSFSVCGEDDGVTYLIGIQIINT